jgi:hypothetical protein
MKSEKTAGSDMLTQQIPTELKKMNEVCRDVAAERRIEG